MARAARAGVRAACVAALAMVGASCATMPDRADVSLRWRRDPDGGGGALRIWRDGRAQLTTWSPEQEPAGAEDELRLPVRSAPPDGDRARAFAEALPELLRLPRWAHESNTGAGASLQITHGEQVVHDGSRVVLPAIDDLVRPFAQLDGFDSLQALAASTPAGPRLLFSPGDDPAPLGIAIAALGPDVPLRHLAARIAIGERATSLRPVLALAFEASRERDGQGDYFAASALLRLGDPCGIDRVLDVALSSHPEWADEARTDLAASFGRDVVPFWNHAGPDPRPAAVAEFRQWFASRRTTLRFDATTGRYTGDR